MTRRPMRVAFGGAVVFMAVVFSSEQHLRAQCGPCRPPQQNTASSLTYRFDSSVSPDTENDVVARANEWSNEFAGVGSTVRFVKNQTSVP